MSTVTDITMKWRVRKLHSRSAAERIDAIDRIVKRGITAELSLLIECLEDYEPLVRSAAAAGLAAVARVGDMRVGEALLALILTERRPDVSGEALAALWDILRDKAASLLLNQLNHPIPLARQNAAAGLRHRAWDDLKDEQKARVAIVLDDWGLVSELGTSSIKALAEAIEHATPVVRRKAAESLGRIADQRAMDELVRIMRDTDAGEESRKAAAWGIRQFCWQDVRDGDLAFAAVLLNDWERAAAIGAEGVSALGEAMARVSPCHRSALVKAISHSREPGALLFLSERLADESEDSEIKTQIVECLSDSDDDQATAILVQALESRGMGVRKAAAAALEKREWMPGDDAQRCLVAVAREDWDALVELGAVAVKPLLRAVSTGMTGMQAARALAKLGPAGLDALAGMLKSEEADPGLREIASMILAEHGDQRAVGPLLAMLAGDDAAMRKSAVWTLERLGWSPKTPAERAAAAVAHEDWAALARLGALAVDPLAELVQEGCADAEAILILERILERYSRLLSIQQLKKLAGIGNPSDSGRQAWADAAGHPAGDLRGHEGEPADYSRVLGIVQREMSRRGIRAK